MYRHCLRFAAAICLLSTFWSTIRLFDVSIFEWLAALVIPCGLLYFPKESGVPIVSFKLAGAGLALLAFAGIISSLSSFDAGEHLLKVSKLVGAFALMIGLVYISANRRIFSLVEALYLLSVSAAVCSLVAILQGQLGILTGLVPRDIEIGTRMTGLAEHPIEAGLAAAYGIAIGLGLGLYTRKWIAVFLFIAVDAYSMRFSASLTAVLAAIIASVVVCLYARAYKVLFSGAAIGVLTMVAVLTSSSTASGLLAQRLLILYENQGNYETVQSREMQLRKTIDLIDPGTLAVGNGYSSADLPYNREIHNGILAAVFHFGLLGLISQCLLISFFAVRLRSDEPRPVKSILMGCIIVFALSYLSGPPQARPSLWATLIFLGGYLSTSKNERSSAAKVSAFRRPISGPNAGIKPGSS